MSRFLPLLLYAALYPGTHEEPQRPPRGASPPRGEAPPETESMPAGAPEGP